MERGLGLVPLDGGAMTTSAPRPGPDRSASGVRYLLVVSASLGAVALFLLATASANTTLFAEHYSLLLLLNGGIAVMLAAIVGFQLVTL